LIVLISIIGYLLLCMRNFKRSVINSNLENYDDIDPESCDDLNNDNECAHAYEHFIEYCNDI
jgi:hypothetical protein